MDTLIEREKSVSLPGGFMEVLEVLFILVFAFLF